MSATIMRDPTLIIVGDPDGTPSNVDVSCYAYAVDISADTETIDIATFCAPAASELGRTTTECTIAFLWEEALMTALEPMKGQEVEIQLTLNAGDTKSLVFRGRYATLPWGRFELGQRIEVDLPVAILSAVTYETPA